MGRLTHIFISHLHGDHYLGLIGLLSTLHLRNRKDDLFIYGPVGLDEIITMHLKYTEMLLSYKIHFQTLDAENPEILLDTDKVTVSTIPLDHRIPCTGFLFKEKTKSFRLKKTPELKEMTVPEINTLKSGHDVKMQNGSIKYSLENFTNPPRKANAYAYCSDTRYNEDIIPYIQSVDLLYHEATFLADQEKRAYETYHSTAPQAALIALKADVKKLILGHFSIRYKELQPLLEEAIEVFPNSFLAVEGERISIDNS